MQRFVQARRLPGATRLDSRAENPAPRTATTPIAPRPDGHMVLWLTLAVVKRHKASLTVSSRPTKTCFVRAHFLLGGAEEA